MFGAEVINMTKLISTCPCCNGALHIAALQCPECGVELRNTFQMSAFDCLDKEQMDFLLTFLKHRGSLKSLQEEMDISYPTAKKRLEELLAALGMDQEETQKEEEVVEMSNFSVNRNSNLASEIIKAKLMDNGGRATVYTVRGLPCELWMNADGKSFTSDKLPIKPPYEYRVFDVIVDLLISQGGRARKGNGRNYKLGESNCDKTTVVGAVALDRGHTIGNSVFDPVFVFAAILEWAGIAHNERGELVLTQQYRSLL